MSGDDAKRAGKKTWTNVWRKQNKMGITCLTLLYGNIVKYNLLLWNMRGKFHMNIGEFNHVKPGGFIGLQWYYDVRLIL